MPTFAPDHASVVGPHVLAFSLPESLAPLTQLSPDVYLLGAIALVALIAVWLVLRAGRRRAPIEQERRRSDQRLDDLSALTPGFVFRGQPGWRRTLERISQQSLPYLGRPPSEFVSGRIAYLDHIDAADRERVSAAITAATTARQSYAFEYGLHHADGSMERVLECGRGVYDGDKLLFVEGFVAPIKKLNLATAPATTAGETPAEAPTVKLPTPVLVAPVAAPATPAASPADPRAASVALNGHSGVTPGVAAATMSAVPEEKASASASWATVPAANPPATRNHSELDRLGAGRVFLSRVSTDVRAPLHTLLGFTQLLRLDAGLPESALGHLEHIEQEGEHLLTWIDDLVELALLAQGDTERRESSFDPTTLLAGAAQAAQVRAAARGLRLLLEPAPSLPAWITADAPKLRRLVRTALAHTVDRARGQEVVARLAFAGGPSSATPGALRFELLFEATPEVVARLADSPADALVAVASGAEPTSFDLRLTLVQETVRALGGRVWVDSAARPVVGWRFEIPAAAATAASPGARPGLPVLASGQPTVRVLVAESRPADRALLAAVLASSGMETRVAADHSTVHAIASSWSPHLVLLDSQLPDGLLVDTLTTLRQSPTNAPRIVALVASPLDGVGIRHLAGVDDVVEKPIQPTALLARIAQGLGLQLAPATDTGVASAPSASGEATSATSSLPSSLHQRLIAAAHTGDGVSLARLIDEAARHDPQLANTLRERAQIRDWAGLVGALSNRTIAVAA